MNGKLRLNLDDLRVESFETTPGARIASDGTVFGYNTQEETCVTLQNTEEPCGGTEACSQQATCGAQHTCEAGCTGGPDCGPTGGPTACHPEQTCVGTCPATCTFCTAPGPC